MVSALNRHLPASPHLCASGAPYLQRLDIRPAPQAPTWRATNYERAVSIRSRFFLENRRKSL